MVPAPATRPLVVEGLRLLTMVGRGGEGEVWEVRDARDHRRALKLVRPDCLASPEETIARGRWLVHIDHPALVRVHRSGLVSGGVFRSARVGPSRSRLPPPPAHDGHSLDGWGFVEMDFIAGESLASAEADPSVLERLEPLSEALDLLHAGAWSDGVPLVHRDVKPANIVEDADGRFVLVDPSTLRGLDTDDVTRVGTPLFRAPEVMAGHTTTAADVYSFAATIVALATGLRGRDLANLLRDPGLLDLPRGVRRALSPAPGERPVSCRAVLEQGETITIPVLLPWERDPQAKEQRGETAGGPPPAAGALAPGSGDSDRWLGAQDGPSTPAQPATPGWPPPAGVPEARQPHESRGWLSPVAGRPRPLAGALWAVVAAGVFLVPAFAVAGNPDPQQILVTCAGAAAVHLLASIVLGRSVLLAVMLAPVAWAGLIANRMGGSGSRRAWSQTLLLPGCTMLAAAPPTAALLRVQDSGLVALDVPVTVEQVAMLGVSALLLALGAAGLGAGLGAVFRLLGLPLWILGAGALLALCVIALIPALLSGRARLLARFAGDTITSAAELARAPRPVRTTAG
ncbi:MAG: hypothetical protein GEU81_05815 [Nitriliruptorales bacterium]|nr:hypothetical protein [Nitriliruptorales bacterium]